MSTLRLTNYLTDRIDLCSLSNQQVVILEYNDVIFEERQSKFPLLGFRWLK